MIKSINVKTRSRTEFVNITSDVQKIVKESGVKSGSCHVYVPHTTAGITINEGADPSVVRDMQVFFDRLVPRNGDYMHMEGNSDAHVKTSLVGSSQVILVDGGTLVLGTWQAIFFCEFDGARNRKVNIKIISG